jgi:hypothetical protein
MQRVLIVLGVALLLAGIAGAISLAHRARPTAGRYRDPTWQYKLLFPHRNLHPHQHRFQHPDVAVQSLIVNRSLQ